MNKTITGVKGFNKDMTCRDMQYEEGKTYEMEDKPSCCENGYHFCESPIDCFGYYDPAHSVFHEVEAIGDIDKKIDSNDSKICTNKIKIGAKIDLQTMIKMSVDFVFSHCKKSTKKSANKSEDRSIATNSGDRSVATNSGDSSVATNSGDRSVATNSGYRSVATNSGYSSVATNSGDSSVATNSGYRSVATNSGDSSVATNSGDSSVATNSGDRSVATNSGYRSVAINNGFYSIAQVDGDNAVAINLGYEGKAKGKIGSWIILAEVEDTGVRFEIQDVKVFKVDGKKIKEDVFYKLENGKAIAVEEEEE